MTKTPLVRAAFVGACLGLVFAPGAAFDMLRAVRGAAVIHMDQAVVWTVSGCLLACAAIAASPLGARRLGGSDVEAAYGAFSWFAMLFAAGIGSGLMFWGAAEPLAHVDVARVGGENAAAGALALTLFHWTLHPWAVYAITALSLAHFGAKGGTHTLGAPFRRLVPGRPHMVSRAVDLITTTGVLFAVAGALGQGVHQLRAGLTDHFHIHGSNVLDIVILSSIGAAASASAAFGVRKGIRRLSEWNVILAGCFVLIVLTQTDVAETGRYARDGLFRFLAEGPAWSVDLGSGAVRDHVRAWSVDYFLWWIAWAPFVGVFLVRISRGRTVRAFILATILAPSAASWLWFSILGRAALDAAAVDPNVAAASAPDTLFQTLGGFAFADLLAPVALILIALFLITSIDSAAYAVAASNTAEGAPESASDRIFWGLVIMAITGGAVLAGEFRDLDGGVQRATETLAIAAATPLAFVWALNLAAYAVSLARTVGRGRSQSPAGASSGDTP